MTNSSDPDPGTSLVEASLLLISTVVSLPSATLNVLEIASFPIVIVLFDLFTPTLPYPFAYAAGGAPPKRPAIARTVAAIENLLSIRSPFTLRSALCPMVIRRNSPSASSNSGYDSKAVQHEPRQPIISWQMVDIHRLNCVV